MKRPRLTYLVLHLAALAILLPKLSAVVLALHPGVTSAVVCTGAGMVTIQLDTTGQPVEVVQDDQGPCVLAAPHDDTAPAFVGWTAAPRSYRAHFVDLSLALRSQAEIGLLPDLRGPPTVI